MSKPYEKSFFPGIGFEVKISHVKYGEAITGVSGWLETDDGKIIAESKEVMPEVPEVPKVRENVIGAKGTSLDSEFKEDIYGVTLIALLDKKALDHVEERRMSNRKGDVRLVLSLNVKSVVTRSKISYQYEVKPEDIGLKPIRVPVPSGTKDGTLIVYAYDPNFSSDRINRWVISGDGSPIFLSVKEEMLRGEKTISSSDWLHDYAPKLELGEYFVIEIPKGGKIIEKAWDYVEKAEECFRRWDTKGTYANCREAGYLLDKIVKDKFGKENFSYKEKWGRGYARFEHMASLDLHLEQITEKQQYTPQEVRIGKEDVEHILIVTKAMVKYAENLLESV